MSNYLSVGSSELIFRWCERHFKPLLASKLDPIIYVFGALLKVYLIRAQQYKKRSFLIRATGWHENNNAVGLNLLRFTAHLPL